MNLSIDVTDEILEAIATRAAELVAANSSGQQEEGFVDVAGAAAYLSCPKSRVYSLVSARRLPHHRDGSRLLFDRAELRDYVHNGGAKRP